MPAFTSGAELLKALKDSGTGDGKIVIGERLLAAAEKLHGEPTDVPAETMYERLMAELPDEGYGHGTREKLRQIYTTGKYVGPPRALSPLERVLDPNAAKAAKVYEETKKQPSPETVMVQEAVLSMQKEMQQQFAAMQAMHAKELADLRAELELQREAEMANTHSV